MKAIILSLLILSVSPIMYAQFVNFNWAKQMGGPSIETGYSVITDAAGNVYTTGNFKGSADFDPGPGVFIFTATSTADIFISKKDPAGNFIWARQMKGTNYAFGIAIGLDNMQNIYISGSFAGGVDFDPGPGLYEMSSIGSINAFIAKMDNDGNFKWAKQLGPNNTIGNALSMDFNGDILITGISTRGLLNDAFITKVTTGGNILWTKYFNGSSSFCSAKDIKTDAAGNIYTTGYFSSNVATDPVDFDPGSGVFNLRSFGGTDIFISKLNKNGEFVWVQQIGGPRSEEGSAIAVDALGNIFITGFFHDKIDADPGPGVFNITALGDLDIFVSKFDAAGNLVWAKQMGGLDFEEGNSIAVDAGGNVYLTGHFYGTVDFDPGAPDYNLVSKGVSDIFISKLDGNGNFRWVKQIGGISYDWSYEIFLDQTGNIFTTGYFDDVVDFDIGSAVYNLTSYGNKDIFVLKLTPCSNFTTSAVTASVCKNYTLNGQTYSATGIYTQYLINAAGCDSIITLDLTVNEKLTIINKTICQGQTYYAAGANQSNAGIYLDTLLTTIGCDSVIRTILSVNPKPKPDLGPDGKLCTNSEVSITPGIFNSYLWQDHSTQPKLYLTSAGKYWVTVTDINNCSATDTINILSIDTIPENFLPPGQDLCYGNVLRITAPGNYLSYQWSTGSRSDFIDVTAIGTYYLTVTDFNSCTGTDAITINRKNCIYIGIPNAFTPNGDSKNDIFKPAIFQQVMSFSLAVFNRYGQRIFETSKYDKGWDGTVNGIAMPSGSYVYNIKYTNIFGTETVETGSVLLIR